MGDLDDTKPRSKEETLEEAIKFLDDVAFSMACFVNSFKRYCEKAGFITKDDS